MGNCALNGCCGERAQQRAQAKKFQEVGLDKGIDLIGDVFKIASTGMEKANKDSEAKAFEKKAFEKNFEEKKLLMNQELTNFKLN